MSRRLALAVVGGALAGTALARSHANAREVPLSPVLGDGYIGPDWVDRRGIGREPRVGEMDDMAAYASAAFDPEAVDGEVRRFYERTTGYRMRFRTTWHRPFRTGARLAARATSRLEQLNLPVDGELRALESDIVAVDPAVDPRDGARAWTRIDEETGEAVFVALYASHVHDGERYTNIAVPLPGSNLSTVLRPENMGSGLRLTTFAPGHPGLYLVTAEGEFALPMDQRFRVWPAGESPVEPPGDGVLAATHEMWLGPAQFLTVTYGIERDR
ncbi:hypothetical protein [Natronomonas sp. EA1]|uniref:hypothetical protein n=1 Tax=Natronomonas sp. EA1 TaxID=3421655 RepID=UPI003EB9A1A9